MVISPVLAFAVVFAATEIATVSLPVPLLPEVIVAQGRELVDVHAQLFDDVVTVTLSLSVAEVKVRLVGEML